MAGPRVYQLRSPVTWDVAIVGLGTAGAAAAAACAEAGLRVIGLDRSPLDQTGARWCNGVPGWAFDESGFDRPTGAELHGDEGNTFHLVAGWDLARVTTKSVLDVDMRHLTTRLLDRARAHGAELRGGVKVRGLDGDALITSDGPVRATTIVDAAGLVGPRLDERPATPRVDLCVAAQEVRQLTDPSAARAFFESRDAKPGEIVCFAGVDGGYSILSVRLLGDRVSILTGSIPALGHRAGTVMLDRFVADNPWVGAVEFGGRRAIPLGLPHPVVGAGRVARIGDSAGMVHAAHGSGIAQQLLAARLLARTLASGGSPATFNVAWQRQYGGVLSGADLFRRFSQTLTLDELRRLIADGVLNPALMADTLAQRPVRPPLGALLGAGVKLVRIPGVARRMVPVVARLKAMELHHRRYPDDPERLPKWIARRASLAAS